MIQELSEIKTSLAISGTDDDALLTELQSAADSFVEEYCGRSFTGGTFTEDHPGGTRMIFLRNFPVATVITVHVDPLRKFGESTLLDPSGYSLLADRGVIECLSGTFIETEPYWPASRNRYPDTVRVQYTTATDQIPGIVKKAHVELVSHWYRQTKTMVATNYQNVLTQTNGSVVTSYPWGQSLGMKAPQGVLELLKLVRVPRL